MIKGLLAAFALAAVTTAAASAQQYPGPYYGGYGSGYGNQQQQMQGVVTSFNAFDLYVQSGGRQSRYVRLHQGTVINPRGTTLQNGMPVRVVGYVDNGGTFQANEVDVANNGNCGGYGGYGNGQYGSGYYNNGGYASCSSNGNNGHWNNGRRRHGDNDEDRDDRGDRGDNRDNNRYSNQYPYPYPTYPPNR